MKIRIDTEVNICYILYFLFFSFIVFSFSIPDVFSAEPFDEFVYQGLLQDSNGGMITATKDITLNIYTTLTGGSALWSENHNGVSVNKGLFSIYVGSQTSFSQSLDFTEALYLETIIKDSNGLNAETLLPRLKLVGSPFALSASRASVDFNLNDKQLFNATSINATALMIMQTGSALVVNVTNTGTGDSFRVNDEISDSTPFVIDSDGNVSIGGSSLTVNGTKTCLADGTYCKSVSIFHSKTSTSYTSDLSGGGFVGYEAGNYLCDQEFTNTHMCYESELVLTIDKKDITTIFEWSNSAWIITGGAKFSPADVPANDCNGFTHGTPDTYLGSFWLFDQTGGGVGGIGHCANTIPLACCKAGE